MHAHRGAKHNDGMDLFAQAAALIAAAIHVWFFVLESLWFERPSVHRRFGLTTLEQVAAVRSWAFNQGFYNLFLAAGAVIGVGLVATGSVAPGRALVLFACGSMVAAGIVLVAHNRSFARAAAIQALPPLAAIVEALISQPQ